MKNNIMKKWVKALRSGKFKQGQGTLKQFNKRGEARHCCLGVLCELYNSEMKKNKKKTLPEKIFNNDSEFLYGCSKFGTKTYDLPKQVKEWSGVKNALGQFYNKDDQYNDIQTLADLNDSGLTFKTIANTIEKNWESL